METAKKWFCLSAGVIFSISGMAKVWSAWGSARLLQHLDPILNIQFGHLMFAAGVLELLIASICLFNRRQMLVSILVAWLATSLLIYRMGLWWIGWQRPCNCLGNLTDALHISQQTADTVMKIILAYLLIGSYAILFWLWRQKRKVSQSIPSPEVTNSAA